MVKDTYRLVWFEDSCAGTDDVGAAEVFVGFVEGVFELGPDCYVGLDVDGAGSDLWRGVFVDQLLCFGAESNVCD